jgi:methylmalonic aciduria homocystinuria type C protein
MPRDARTRDGARARGGALTLARARLETREREAMENIDAVEVVETLARACAARGLDVVAACSAADYDAAAPETARIGAREDGRATSPLVALIGNSKALWPAFADALARDGTMTLDEYCERVVRDAAADAIEVARGFKRRSGEDLSSRVRIFWASDVEEGKVIAIQRLAHVANCAWLDENTHQSIHPLHGPWCAFRAAVVFDDVEEPDEEDLQPKIEKCPVSDETLANAKAAFDVAIERFNATDGKDPEQWRLWLAARDAMGGGAFAKERYYEDQILWHYDVDREGVRKRLARGVKTV